MCVVVVSVVTVNLFIYLIEFRATNTFLSNRFYLLFAIMITFVSLYVSILIISVRRVQFTHATTIPQFQMQTQSHSRDLDFNCSFFIYSIIRTPPTTTA